MSEACMLVVYPPGSDFGKMFRLEPDKETTIGRSSTATISIDRDSVSRQHCRVYMADGEFFVEDVGSTNGTYVNDFPVQRAPLRDGDFVKAGSAIFKFLRGGIEHAYHEEIHRELQQARARVSEISSGPVTQVTSMLTAFIAYGQPDFDFAEKLNAELRAHGVKTWFFPKSARPGQKIHQQAHYNINTHDRMIAICSKDSLVRSGFLNELQTVFDREAREAGVSYLIPVRLDDAVFHYDWAPLTERS
jgi:pSer/pThr/pTyr-binding forkhead associated (FHA) protein